MSDVDKETGSEEASELRKAGPSRVVVIQVVGLIMLLVILVIISVTTGLLVTGQIKMPTAKPQVSSILSAQDICDDEIRKDKGAMLNSYVVDSLSSRYDAAMGKFKMFYQIELYLDKSRQTGTAIYYVNCFISARRGVITQMDYMENKSFVPKAVRRTNGNAFGL